jgi:hypothetical protein
VSIFGLVEHEEEVADRKPIAVADDNSDVDHDRVFGRIPKVAQEQLNSMERQGEVQCDLKLSRNEHSTSSLEGVGEVERSLAGLEADSPEPSIALSSTS